MDLQGQPISRGPTSTKVTTDPEATRNPIHEPAGPVPSDSLAAESATKGGAFSENRGAQPDAPGSRSANASGATELPSARVGAARENLDRQEKYPEALGGQGNYPGPHVPESGYVGGPSAAKQELGIGKSQASGSGYSQYNGGQAPSYAVDATGQYADAAQYGKAQPKGVNLTEGGFEGDRPNASFGTDIGSKNDPGRAAEHKFQRTAAESGPDAGGGPRQKGVDNQHPFQHLQSDQRA
ncbi:hypothetical protein P170DRAFT_480451 [Aspergillus steynii IBT 23096]|uniref:Uncharacterized protein n=1 Tax=Aspergillus steynii IBT 23096 TaxID=1392250 RepID=A0A2I2FS84_9EURO|nr:uncharacterized protein P170DRAFT_480451 [Aspergillus steynii IBT 23096]PLB43477.1 hypothetical protein P170DRAFT_480451 [Aspergillus steynii IBT 23096]